MTTDTPLTRYRAIKRAPASGSSLPSYTTWWDTTSLCRRILEKCSRQNPFFLHELSLSTGVDADGPV
jgi:hypothetical protein